MNNNLLLIIVSGALINNVVLSQFLGICSFLGVSKQMKASVSLGGAVIFVITIASAVAWLLYTYVLAPLGLEFMKTIVFILVIAALVQIVEMFLTRLLCPLDFLGKNTAVGCHFLVQGIFSTQGSHP